MTILFNTNTDNISKDIYINSIEASNIVSHMTRGTYINHDFVGMIPNSLLLNQLIKQGLHVYPSMYNTSINRSRDIINVKFKQNLQSASEMIKYYEKELSDLEVKEMLEAQDGLTLSDEDEEYRIYLEDRIQSIIIESESDEDNWGTVKTSELREKLYAEGFTITNEDGTVDKFKLYIRSSSKSRVGQCLFIKEKLKDNKHFHENMLNWNRMGLQIDKDQQVDLPKLRAYESLVGSSIFDTIEIDPSRILVIDDVKSVFTEKSNVVSMSEDGDLVNKLEDIEVANDIWDGQSLLDVDYFPEGAGFKLLRNHFFKSAAFNTNLREFIKQYAKDNGIDYDTWMIMGKFGEIKASEIDMITTPNSLKMLSFSSLVGTETDMYEHWKQAVYDDGMEFGVCEVEQQSKHVTQGSEVVADGVVMREMSYQIMNSLQMDEEDMEQLAAYEVEYIELLKNDPDVFIKHLEKFADDQNSNEMYINLYHHNPGVIGTKGFKELRKRTIANHVKHCQRGRIRLEGDYLVMIGDGLSMLYAGVGDHDIKLPLQANEVHTTMFDDGQELSGFRSPHTSGSNVWVARNVINDDIGEWFNSTDNIVHLSSKKNNILNRLSGSDFDSDSLLMSSDSKLLELSKRAMAEYPVVINDIKGEPKSHKFNEMDMYLVDQDLSNSTQLIGDVTNRSQMLLSVYWDALANGEDVEGMLDSVAVLTALSGVSIDLAKESVDINISAEVRKIQASFKRKQMNGEEKYPNFWVNIGKGKGLRGKVTAYDTPMDYLLNIMRNIDDADEVKSVELQEILVRQPRKHVNKRQLRRIKSIVTDLNNETIKVMSSNNGDEDERMQKMVELDGIINKHTGIVGKYKIKKDTMYAILLEHGEGKMGVRLMNTLFKTHNEIFMDSFVKMSALESDDINVCS